MGRVQPLEACYSTASLQDQSCPGGRTRVDESRESLGRLLRHENKKPPHLSGGDGFASASLFSPSPVPIFHSRPRGLGPLLPTPRKPRGSRSSTRGGELLSFQSTRSSTRFPSAWRARSSVDSFVPYRGLRMRRASLSSTARRRPSSVLLTPASRADAYKAALSAVCNGRSTQCWLSAASEGSGRSRPSSILPAVASSRQSAACSRHSSQELVQRDPELGQHRMERAGLELYNGRLPGRAAIRWSRVRVTTPARS